VTDAAENVRSRGIVPTIEWKGREHVGWFGLVVRRFRQHRLATAGLLMLTTLTLVAVLAPAIAPYDPYKIDLRQSYAAPGRAHLLGTDISGRDVLSRLIHASRVSLSVGLVSVSIYLIIGTILGAFAGYYGRSVDMLIMRLADVVLSFPVLIIIITVVAIVGPNVYNIMMTIGFLGWPPTARLVRGLFLSLREQDFTLAARMVGARDGRIIFRHILPNVYAPIIVAGTFGVAAAILIEAGLSFLGLGVQPPTASWGNMLTDAQSLTILESMPWLWIPPGVMIVLAVLSINFVGDGLRDALDPRTVIHKG